jgi:hypothetical protein
MQESSSLLEVIDRILDKGIVIDVWLTVSALGLELLTLEARIVVASCETYMKYAEGIGLTMNVAPPRVAALPVAALPVAPVPVAPVAAAPVAAAPVAAAPVAAAPVAPRKKRVRR